MNRKAAFRFAGLHFAGITVLLLFPLYVKISKLISLLIPGCLLHDLLHLYCPLCGGTRAVSAILKFDFSTALRCNLLVIPAFVVFTVLYVRAWVRLLKGKKSLFDLPSSLWIAGLVFLIGFGILRNVLMICAGIDPLGDLVVFWNRK